MIRIKISRLFNQFDYNITLKTEGLTILTGPNGYGKTTILKIINAVYQKNVFFFLLLPFSGIVIESENQSAYIIKKTSKRSIEIIYGDFKQSYHQEDMSKILKNILMDYPMHDYRNELSHFNGYGENLSPMERFVTEFYENDFDLKKDIFFKKLPNVFDVYLIKEQRLVKNHYFGDQRNRYREKSSITNYSLSIENYAKELAGKLKNLQAEAAVLGQSLDSTFPTRLFNQTEKISETEFKHRYDKVRDKLKRMSKLGLSEVSKGDQPSYNEENSKALAVYLNDTEKKMEIFDPFLEKLELFAGIIHNRGFTNKALVISPEVGFNFKASGNGNLVLSQLSSGEQHEVVMIYELLFRAEENALVLIDEPEMSLHVVWQQEFLNDILKLIKLKKFNVIVATHSPQIINDKWDMTIDLGDLISESKE